MKMFKLYWRTADYFCISQCLIVASCQADLVERNQDRSAKCRIKLAHTFGSLLRYVDGKNNFNCACKAILNLTQMYNISLILGSPQAFLFFSFLIFNKKQKKISLSGKTYVDL